MSDPLAGLQDETPKQGWSKDSKSKPPDFKEGDRVQLKDFHGKWDFDLKVVQVYWAGVPPNEYWMVHVKMGDNKNASIWAPHWHYINITNEFRGAPEVKLALPLGYDSCLVCGGEHCGLPCPKMKVMCIKEITDGNAGRDISSNSSSGISNENSVGDPLLSLLEDE